MTEPDHVNSRWLRRYHTSAAIVRLVCFPHAGGSASFFHAASLRLSGRADVLALQYPGRQDRRHEPCITDIATLADRVAAELAPLPPRPTVFFGHSLGAILAFEVAWRLECAGAPSPHTLIASGRRGPGTEREESVHRRDDEGILAAIAELNEGKVAALGNDEILRMSLPAIRADYQAIETYRCPPDRRIRADVVVHLGDRDPLVTREEADEWVRHTEGSCRTITFAGGHFFLVDEFEGVLDAIARELEKHELSAAQSRPAGLGG